jgi:hypothetical protein
VSIALAPWRRGLLIEPHQAATLAGAAEDIPLAGGELLRKLDEVGAGADVTLTREEVEALSAIFATLTNDQILAEDEMQRLRRAVADALR